MHRGTNGDTVNLMLYEKEVMASEKEDYYLERIRISFSIFNFHQGFAGRSFPICVDARSTVLIPSVCAVFS